MGWVIAVGVLFTLAVVFAGMAWASKEGDEVPGRGFIYTNEVTDHRHAPVVNSGYRTQEEDEYLRERSLYRSDHWGDDWGWG